MTATERAVCANIIREKALREAIATLRVVARGGIQPVQLAEWIGEAEVLARLAKDIEEGRL